MKKMPRQKRGESKQDYGTPPEFIKSVVRRFGPLVWDLAASFDNRKAPFCYTKRDNGLAQDWTTERHRGNNWLNPEFGNIAPWARLCDLSLARVDADTTRRDRHDWRVLLLVPASVGSVWYAHHVHGRALVMPLRPRIIFIGETHGFPKDLMLCAYGERPGFEPWRWD